MLNEVFMIGLTPMATPIYASIAGGFLTLLAGISGCGKTTMTENILRQMMIVYGACIQFIVIDPKRIGFIGFMDRCYVFTDVNEWLRLLQSLENEMLRRYEQMAQACKTYFEITPESPYILLVIDELNSLTNNPFMTKKEREEVSTKLISLSNQMRQASMGMLLITQSADTTVIPSIVRANCSTRIAMKTTSEAQVKMITGDREDEAPASTLYMAGEFYGITNETNGKYIRGKTWQTTPEKSQEIMEKVNPDKRPLYCLDWKNPDFLG